MNRRNFVVGLGTVATISGVASVTAAAFQDSVNPTTNFQIVPEDANLTVRRLERDVDYNQLDANASWNESEITDFGNVTAEQNNPVVAHINTTTNDQMGAQLAFNSSNATNYTAYEANSGAANPNGEEWGFFEVANLGETTENVGIEFNSSSNVGTDGIISTQELQNMFRFKDEAGTQISPDGDVADDDTPANFSQDIPSGEVEVIGLKIVITDGVYDKIQEAAGGAFSATDHNIKLLDSIVLGTQQ